MSTALQVRRADALYFGIATAVTIIELAVIATTPGLGEFALEFALILQLLVAVVLEFGAAVVVVSGCGVIKSVSVGFGFKTLSCCFFFGGVFAAQYSISLAWIVISLSFVMDSIGTGVLRSTFRPAYSALNFDLLGVPANYVGSLKGFQSLRVGLPCLILLLVSVVNVKVDNSIAYLLMFVIVMMCRLVQVVLTRRDLFGVFRQCTPTRKLRYSWFVSVLLEMRRDSMVVVMYVGGTILESVVLLYGIGLIYKYRAWMPLPDTFSWLGASVISFVLYVFSFFGAAVLVGRWKELRVRRNLSFGIMVMTLLVMLVVTFFPPGTHFFIALVLFCFAASLVGLLITRHASTRILARHSEQRGAEIFTGCELIANFSLVLIVAIALVLLGAEGIIRLFAFLSALLLVLYFSYGIKVRGLDGSQL
ncbi:hypothetical protein D3C81_630420 [compost metagenome]